MEEKLIFSCQKTNVQPLQQSISTLLLFHHAKLCKRSLGLLFSKFSTQRCIKRHLLHILLMAFFCFFIYPFIVVDILFSTEFAFSHGESHDYDVGGNEREVTFLEGISSYFCKWNEGFLLFRMQFIGNEGSMSASKTPT